MTNTPIRAVVYTATEPIENPTLRQLVEWSKGVVDVVDDPSPQELSYIQQAWAAMVSAKAESEGIPAGHLSYMLQELQIAEQRVLEQAFRDATGADVS